MNLSQIIKEYREKNNLSQRQFAARCGLSNVWISKIESEKSDSIKPYKIETLSAIASAMRISLEDLFALTGNIRVNIENKPLVNGDEELTEYLEAIRDDPNLRMLFSVTKGAKKEDIERAVKIIQTLKEMSE